MSSKWRLWLSGERISTASQALPHLREMFSLSLQLALVLNGYSILLEISVIIAEED
jgi:hypothetical protein